MVRWPLATGPLAGTSIGTRERGSSTGQKHHQHQLEEQEAGGRDARDRDAMAWEGPNAKRRDLSVHDQWALLSGPLMYYYVRTPADARARLQ